MRGLRRRLLLLSAILVGGCGSSGGGNPIPIDNLESEYVAAGCAYLVRCNFIADMPLCSQLFAPLFEVNNFNSLGASVASAKAGKSKYDGASARRCVDALRNLSCSANGSLNDPACQKMFTGNLADGSRCIADAACLPGSFCAMPAGTGTAACDGTCVPGGTLCNSDGECTGGQVCDQTTSTATSLGTCVTPVPAGAAGAPCGTNDTCRDGLWCSTSATPHTCMPLGQVGATCEGLFSTGCAPGLICVPDDTGTTTTCMTDARKGQACQAVYQCGGYFSTLYCDETTTHTCVDTPSTGPCAGSATSYLLCNFINSYCDTTQATPTCAPFKASGSSCDPSGASGPECGSQSGATCQATVAGGTTGTCVTTPPANCTP